MGVVLSTPIQGGEAEKLRVGDMVHLSGIIITARDSAHRLILENGLSGLDLLGAAIYHCGPIVRDGKVISAGPTTSMRMDSYTPHILEEKGVKLIIGKGGMGESTSKALRRTGSAYLSFLGGGGALAAECLRLKNVLFLEELGMAEAIWILDAENFGPLTVTMDSTGASMYRSVARGSAKVMEELMEKQ